jgi:hypothetical protein
VTEPLPEVVAAASRLRAAIEETAAALAGADLPRLLASDTLVQTALNQLPRHGSLAPEQRSHLRHEVEEAQATLRRCRRLGLALNEFVRLSLDAQGHAAGYQPAGPAVETTGRSFNEKA